MIHHRLFAVLAPVCLLAACQTSGNAPAPEAAAAAIPLTLPAVKDLPVQTAMPDPLTFYNGHKVTTLAEWRRRREEMKQILEEYEYGHMPPPPGNVKGTEVSAKLVTIANRGGPTIQTNYRLIHLTFGPEEKLGFDIGIFTPAAPTAQPVAPFPTLISLGFSATETSAAQASAALARGYAVVTIPYAQLGADSRNYRQTAFFPAYPTYDWNDFSAWAWGISRAVDYLQHDPAIDPARLIITGVSRTGQAALLAGAFDERIAMVAPVGGGSALRFSGKDRGGGQGIDEVVDQNTYWFGPRFPEFKGQTDRLPCDQHWLLTLAAPRPFILCNALSDQYGKPNAACQTYLGAKPVYALLGAPDNLGLNFRPGQHGMNALDWQALLDFADLHLRRMPVERRFDVLPTPDQLR